jgi:membrane protein DedA with SNARE-associated domain
VLIEGLLERLLALPAPAVYLVIGTLATVENIIPLVPADTAVALGAFLAQRGLTTPLNVFLVTWVVCSLPPPLPPSSGSTSDSA